MTHIEHILRQQLHISISRATRARSSKIATQNWLRALDIAKKLDLFIDMNGYMIVIHSACCCPAPNTVKL